MALIKFSRLFSLALYQFNSFWFAVDVNDTFLCKYNVPLRSHQNILRSNEYACIFPFSSYRNLFLFSNLRHAYRNNKDGGLINGEFKVVMQSIRTNNLGEREAGGGERERLPSTSSPSTSLTWNDSPSHPPPSFLYIPCMVQGPLAKIHHPLFER